LWRAPPDEGCYDTCWLIGLWFTQAKVEGIMLKAAWHWGRDCSVINNSLGEPSHTPLYVVGLRPGGALWTVTMCFPRFSWEGSLLGTLTDINEGTNHWLWR